MAVSVTFPGVYITEDASLALSISGRSTAVPVFIGVFAPRNGVPVGECVRVENWMDFLSKFYTQTLLVRLAIKEMISVKDTKSKKKKSPVIKDQPEPFAAASEHIIMEVGLAIGSFSLRHYFENGGGTCYVLSMVGEELDFGVDTLAPAIAAIPDITLLVYCEYLKADRDLMVYQALNLLLLDNQGCFLLADSPDGKTLSGLESTQAAAYYPAFETQYMGQSIYKGEEVDLSTTEVYLKNYEGYATLTALKAVVEGDNPPDGEVATYDNLLIEVEKVLNSTSSIYLRASPAMAGLYATTDRTRGVWKAPANIAVAGVKSLVEIKGTATSATPVFMTPSKLSDVHGAGVNAIRSFSGRVSWSGGRVRLKVRQIIQIPTGFMYRFGACSTVWNVM